MHEMKRSYFDIQYSIFKAAYGEWKRYPSGFYPLQEQLPFPDRPYFVIISGSQRLSSGINNTISRKITSVTKKGAAPLRRSPVFILKTLRTKNKFTPIGGAISPISRLTTYNIPNQTRSNPSFVSKGAKIGIVSMVMVIESKREPRMR